MEITKVTIENIMSHKSLEFKPGRVTKLTGKNGSGKTGVLRAIASALGGGTGEAKLLRNGAEEGETVIMLGPDNAISARVDGEDKLTQRKKTDGVWAKITQAKAKEMSDQLAINLKAFMDKDAATRLDLFLGAIPATTADLNLGTLLASCETKPGINQHPLKVLAAIDKDLRVQRQNINRAAKEKRSTITQMKETLPADAPGGVSWKDEKLRLAGERDAKAAERDELIRKSAIIRDESTSKVREECLKSESEFRQTIAAQIEELKKQEADAIAEVRTRSHQLVDGFAQAHSVFVDEINSNTEPILTKLSTELGAAESNASQQLKAEGVRETIKTMSADADKMESRSDQFSVLIVAVEVKKEELLKHLPIAGIEVKDGDIWVDGVAFPGVNTGKRIGVLFEVAKMKCSHLPVPAICLDGYEALDSASQAEFERKVVDSGLWAFVTEVTDGEFAVETV